MCRPPYRFSFTWYRFALSVDRLSNSIPYKVRKGIVGSTNPLLLYTPLGLVRTMSRDSGDYDGESMMSYNAYSDNDLEEHYTDNCSPSMHYGDEHYIDNCSPSMDDWEEHYYNNYSPSMEDMVESHNDYGFSSMEANIHKPSHNKKKHQQLCVFTINSKSDINKLAKSSGVPSSSRRRHEDKSSDVPQSSRRRHTMRANTQEPRHVDHHMDRQARPQRERHQWQHHVDPHEPVSTRHHHMEHDVDHQGHHRHEDPPRRNNDLHRHSSSSSRRRHERSASAHDQVSRLATDLQQRIEHLDDEARGWSLRHLRLELFLQDIEEILLPRHHATTPTPQVRHEERNSKNSNNKVAELLQEPRRHQVHQN